MVLILHTALVLLFRRRGRHPPEVLEFPRVELFALLLMTQPIGQSAASANLRCRLIMPWIVQTTLGSCSRMLRCLRWFGVLMYLVQADCRNLSPACRPVCKSTA